MQVNMQIMSFQKHLNNSNKNQIMKWEEHSVRVIILHDKFAITWNWLDFKIVDKRLQTWL